MANSMTEIRNWLKSQHIVVPDDWLEACLNWVMEEHHDEYLSPTKIKEYVYEQWLIADLREIGSSSLPDTIFSDQKSTLQGIHSLQMLDVRDISQPSYSQLLKLQGKDNQNAKVSAEPQLSAQPWEIRPNRMLVMTLTDGIKSLKAMEYKPVPSLRFDLPPGIKLQICGPVDCRLGILLLSAENIQILGGEVEALVAENSNERVLLRELGQDGSFTEDRNREVSQSFDSGIISESSINVQHARNSMNAINPSRQNSRQKQMPINSTLSRRTSPHMNMSSFRTNIETIDLTASDEVKSFPDSTREVAGNDEFEDDDEFLTSLDYDHLDQLVQECSGSSPGGNRNKTVKDSSSCKIRTPPPMLSDIPDWDLDDFI